MDPHGLFLYKGVSGMNEPILIVEGITDKKHIKKMLAQPLEIICTYGTLGLERLDELIYEYDLDHRNVYILVDEDYSGYRLREQFREELPHAVHLYTSKTYREVAATPEPELARMLAGYRFRIKPVYMM
ncbi:toprim domain-containing protein [Salimicrobium salexigens]|nr:topoisomerase [Salimicrobium salexigens]SDY00238.1 toprim domain protein [Salimicrobium album]SIS71511.1 toprim domain protein [Salimicrobium salexigens]